MEDISLIHEDHLQRVIGLLRASYTHLIFDLSKRFTPTDLTAMRMADVILLVAQLELTSLRNVVRMLHTLGTEEGAGGKGQGHRQPRRLRGRRHHLKKAEETIGQADLLAGAERLQVDARRPQRRRAAVTHAPKSKLQASLAELANALCGKTAAGQPKRKNADSSRSV